MFEATPQFAWAFDFASTRRFISIVSSAILRVRVDLRLLLADLTLAHPKIQKSEKLSVTSPELEHDRAFWPLR